MTKNIIKVLSSSVVAQLLTMIVTLVVVRNLSLHEFADYSFYLGVSAITSGFFANIINRYIIFSDVYNMVKFSYRWVVCISGLLFFIFVIHKESLVILSVIISVHMVIFEISKTYYQKNGEFTKFGLFQIFKSTIILFSVSLLTLNNNLTAQNSLISVILSLFLVNVVFFPSHNKNEVPLYHMVKSVLLNNTFLSLYFVIIPIMSQSSQWFLRFGVSVEEQGYFSLAFYIYSISMLIVASMKKVFISELAKKSNSECLKDIKSVTWKITVVAIIFSVFIFSVLPYIGVVINKNIENVRWPLFILLSSSIFSMLLSPYSELLQKNKKHKDLFYSGLLSLSTMFILGLVLKYLGMGSALSFSLVYLVSYFILNYSIYLRAKSCMHC